MIPLSDNVRRWAVVGLLFFGMVISYVDRGNMNIAAVPVMRDYGFSATQMGMLMSMFFWTYGSFQVPAGFLVDRFGVRRIYAAALLLWCLATAAMGLARNFGELAALRLLLGAGEAVSPLASMAFIKQNFHERDQGLPTSIYVAGLTLGPAIGAIVGTWLLDAYGWRLMFIITGLAGCVWLLPWLMLVADGKRSVREPAQEQLAAPSLREFLTTPIAWGLSGSVFFYSYYWYFFLSWVPTYLVLKHGMPNLRMGVMMAAPLAGMALVNVCSGAFADRIIGTKGNPIRIRKLFVCAGFLCASSLIALAGVQKGGPVLPILLFSFMGVGIGAGNYWALSQAAAPRALVARALGFQNMVAQAAGAAAPVLTAFLLGPEQDFRTAIMVAGACPLVALAALAFLVRQRDAVAPTMPAMSMR